VEKECLVTIVSWICY